MYVSHLATSRRNLGDVVSHGEKSGVEYGILVLGGGICIKAVVYDRRHGMYV